MLTPWTQYPLQLISGNMRILSLLFFFSMTTYCSNIVSSLFSSAAVY